MTRIDRTTEPLSVLAGLALTLGLTLLSLGALGRSHLALIAGITLLAPLTPAGLAVGRRAWSRREQAVPRRYYEKPVVADPVDLRGGGWGDWGGPIGF